jgi:hypothetical protein
MLIDARYSSFCVYLSSLSFDGIMLSFLRVERLFIGIFISVMHGVYLGLSHAAAGEAARSGTTVGMEYLVSCADSSPSAR